MTKEHEEKALNEALRLIKVNFDDDRTSARNRDLHSAIQLIVDVARNNGLLYEHGVRMTTRPAGDR